MCLNTNTKIQDNGELDIMSDPEESMQIFFQI